MPPVMPETPLPFNVRRTDAIHMKAGFIPSLLCSFLGTVYYSFVLLVHRLDVFLDEFKGGEKDGIDDTRAAHGYPQTSVHVFLKEFDLRGRDLLSFRVQ